MKRRLILLVSIALMAISTYAVATRVIGNGSITGNTRTISTSSCKVYAILGMTTNTASQYIHIYSKIASMTNGGTPTFSFPIAATNYYFLDFSAYGADMDQVAVCNSTTAQTTTLGSTNCTFQAVISQ